MLLRSRIILTLIFALLPLAAVAQTYDPNQNGQISRPGNLPGSFSLSTACSTPLTPASCASTSYKIFNLAASGFSDFSFQVNTMPSGDTLSFYSSNDGVNFFASNVAVPGGTPSSVSYASSVTAAGKFSDAGGSDAYVAVVMTAGTSAVSVIPYLSQSSSGVRVRSAVPITVQGSSSASPIPISGSGTAGSPAGGVVSVQGCGGCTALSVTGTVTGSLSLPYSAATAQPTQAASFGGAGGLIVTAPAYMSSGSFSPLQVNNYGSLLTSLCGQTTTNVAYCSGVAYTNPTNSPNAWALSTQSFTYMTNGTNADQAFYCSGAPVAINVSSATTTALIAATSGKSIRVCTGQFSIAGTSPTYKFEYGTQTTTPCDTGTTAITGTVSPASGAVISLETGGASNSVFVVPAGNALCLVSGGTSTSIQGHLTAVTY